MGRYGVALTVLLALAAPAAGEIVTRQSGPWSSPATWGGARPTSADVARIAQGHLVTLDVGAEVAGVEIDGTLRVARDRSTRLTVGCHLRVRGRLDQGTAGDPIPAGVTHDLVFRLTQAQAAAFVGGPHFEPTDCGLWVFGRWDAHGAPVLRTWGRLAADVPAGATGVVVDGSVADWPVGSRVVLTQTSEPHDWWIRASDQRQFYDVRHETEIRTLAAAEGSRLTLTAPVMFPHEGTGELRGAVGLLTRTVTIRTALEGDTASLPIVLSRLYAHTIIMPGGSADLQYVAFERMGHYGADGRYATHHHRLGEGSRGTVVRGVSWLDAGFRCTNLHESHGVLVEDTVCVRPGGGAAHMVQVDKPSTQQDHAFVHNLVASPLAKDFGDRSNDFPGERGREASGFWPGAAAHEAFVGNLTAGAPLVVEENVGFHWPEDIEGIGGSLSRTFVANEAHAVTFAGFHSWANRGADYDAVASVAWRSDIGIFHGAYGFPLRTYNARLVGNRLGIFQTVVSGFLQDSIVRGSDVDPARLVAPDGGILVGAYAIQPHPYHPSRYLRNTFTDLTPSRDGTPGVAIDHLHDSCDDPPSELKALTRTCTATFFRLAGNRFGRGLRPLHFGAAPNANSYWVDHDGGRVLLRRDQTTPFGELPPGLFTAASRYDPAADAVATPLTSLPPTLTWDHLTSYRHRPYGPFTLSLAHDEPPTVTLAASLTGTQARLRAQASADTTRVEFWVDWVLVATDRSPPFEATVDLAHLAALGDPLPRRRYAYVYARAFDGAIVDAGVGEGGSVDPGYEQRAYSEVIEIGPEILLTGPR